MCFLFVYFLLLFFLLWIFLFFLTCDGFFVCLLRMWVFLELGKGPISLYTERNREGEICEKRTGDEIQYHITH